MKQIHIRESLKAGWGLFMKRPWYLLGLLIAFALLFTATSSQGAVVTALAYVVNAGYLALLLRHYAGETVVFDDIFSVDQQKWISFAFLALIKGVAILLGLVCFIVPGVYLAVRWIFAELYVIDKGMRPLEALKASSELTEGVRWKLFLFSLVSVFLILIGLLFLIVGAFVVSIVCSFAIIKMYKDLQSKVKEEEMVI